MSFRRRRNWIGLSQHINFQSHFKRLESYSTSFASDQNKLTNMMTFTLDDKTGNINVNATSNLNVNTTVNNHSFVDSSNNSNSSRLVIGTNNKNQG